MRLWIEKGIPPEASQDRSLVYLVARSAIAFTWLYHGLVPKLLYQNAMELDLLSRIGTSGSRLHAAVTAAGLAEVFLPCLIIALWRIAGPCG